MATPPAASVRLTAFTPALCQVGWSGAAASLPEQPARATAPASTRAGFAMGRITGIHSNGGEA